MVVSARVAHLDSSHIPDTSDIGNHMHLSSPPIACFLLISLGGSVAAAEDPPILEPATSAPAAARRPEPDRWSWNAPMSTITATGDLAWKPQPFVYSKGASVRYIDYAAGADDHDGLSPATAWKHHPWDPAANGAAKTCAGIQTYVFKRGVVYRGTLVARDAGKPDDPIRLTSDPAWGEGEAVLCGAEAVIGWKQGADRPDIPDAATVWWVDLPYVPKNLWESGRSGIVRIPLARTPNWKVSDPNDVMSEWWTLEQPEWWTGKWKISFDGHRAHMGVDTRHLDQPAACYLGAIVRPEFAPVMGTPYPSRVEGFDEAKKGLIFQGVWTGDSENHWTGNRYYLEDKPQYLDTDGEFWADRRGDGARVYLRLPGDRDPNQSTVEVARQIDIISAERLSEVAITGLTFRFTNTYWDLSLPDWGHADVANAAIRVLGSSEGLRIANCRFDHIAGRALRLKADKPEQRFDRFSFDDNDVDAIDHGAIAVTCGSRGAVEVLRNRMHDIGGRPYRQDWGHALVISYPETVHVAGNILDRCYGAGIFVCGGKDTGDGRDVAFSRTLIHGNRVIDSLLAATDWGGIETWNCGPHFVFNNISGNAVGYWNCTYDPAKKGSACLGFTYYFDGSCRNAVFNNVAWGGTGDRDSKLFAQAAFYHSTPSIENTLFNNTAVDFKVASNWSPAGGRELMLGNLLIDVAGPVFQWGQLKEDTGPTPADYDHASTAIARNVFASCGNGKFFGCFEANGTGYPDLGAMQAALAARKPLADGIGIATDQPVVREAGKGRDLHPLAGSPAAAGGAKVFVPWALGRTVGEWNFRRNHADPTMLLDDHWYPTTYVVKRETFYQPPTWPLQGVGIGAKDYVAGPLEDWTDGALLFDGKDQRAVLANAVMCRPYAYTLDEKPRIAEGKALANPDIDTQDLLIETYIQPKAGQGACEIVSKLGNSGYRLALNRAGGVTLTLLSDGKRAELASGARIADGAWHHVLVEVDRAAGSTAIYTDGLRTANGAIALAKDASLSNGADLVVAKGFAGAFEYLRIARTTLAGSRTSIEELYDWEFAGPFLRDFAGREPAGKRRCAGAFEPVE